jgi:hypothetical protein
MLLSPELFLPEQLAAFCVRAVSQDKFEFIKKENIAGRSLGASCRCFLTRDPRLNSRLQS